MDIEQIRDYCLQKDEVEECFPFDEETLVFKGKGKMFLLASLEKTPLSFNVKCDPEKAIELREQYPCVLPGYHMSKIHWNTVVIDGTLTTAQLKDMIDESYELVTAKKVAKRKKS